VGTVALEITQTPSLAEEPATASTAPPHFVSTEGARRPVLRNLGGSGLLMWSGET
jgi:hypothetical protein